MQSGVHRCLVSFFDTTNGGRQSQTGKCQILPVETLNLKASWNPDDQTVARFHKKQHEWTN